ncbi:MAG: ATP-binding protein [Deltaproteobacteria bacterium]|nr:ATP-binding protein [Deltaproteobacteria bacterium]
MKRNITLKLESWLKNGQRRPLILQGARQVGKTFIITEFGKSHFKKCHTFNFEENREMHSLFEKNFDPKRIIEELSYIQKTPIHIREDLVFFDEIQECPKALTSLKYFCERMPELSLVSAGSLLGIKLSEESFPVGKVDFLHLFPMNFREFLEAGENKMLVEAYDNASIDHPIAGMAHQQLWRELLNYYVTGGMPQVVLTYLAGKENKPAAFDEVRRMQKILTDSFSKDFAKHSGKSNSVHIVSVFENIPIQLSAQVDASTKRYHFNHVIPGKKSFAHLQGPIDWLENAGLIIKVSICNRAEIPLKAFCKNNLFKLFVFDVGVLGSMLHLPIQSILEQDYGITKGYLAENFVAQELLASGVGDLYSWTERNSEIEFLMYRNNVIVPVEVKAGHRTQAKSLQQFIIKYSPSVAIKLSANPFSKTRQLASVPLYFAGKLASL